MSIDYAARSFTIQPLGDADRSWVAEFTREHGGADIMVVHGKQFTLSQLPGFCALVDEKVAGLVTYFLSNGECEVTSLDSQFPGLEKTACPSAMKLNSRWCSTNPVI